MSGMKKAMALTAMAMALYTPNNMFGELDKTPHSRDLKERKRKEREDQIKLERGVKPFEFNGKIYWARTE